MAYYSSEMDNDKILQYVQINFTHFERKVLRLDPTLIQNDWKRDLTNHNVKTNI